MPTAEQHVAATATRSLVSIFENLVVHQAVFAAAELAVADALAEGPCTTLELARQLDVDEDALYRVLRLLAGEGIFCEVAPRTIANTTASECLRTNVPGSLRAMARYRGTPYFYQSFGQILYSVRTGQPARSKLLGVNGWEYLSRDADVARIFDDAMTDFTALTAPVIAASYDFSRWGSLMDVGGGNGMLLAAILRAHPRLQGVLADQPHVIERARQRGLLGEDLQRRWRLEECDFFHAVPAGCRGYLLKSVIHDWDDEHATKILENCRKVTPKDGALLLVESELGAANVHTRGKVSDVSMMIATGGKERTVAEYRDLLAAAGFVQTSVVSTGVGFIVIEALPQ
jgi:C-methyltransferase